MDIIKWDLPGIIAGTTLKNKDMNMALNIDWDTAEVIKNRRTLAAYLGTDLYHMVSPTQTHSTNIQKVTLDEHGGYGMFHLDDALDNVDAMYTFDKDLALLTYHADCIPILLYDPSRSMIAAIHAGWKGNVHEIVLKVLDVLIIQEHIDPKNIYAYIGPSLSKENFEAKEDIIALVKQMSFDTKPYYEAIGDGVYLLDGKGLIEKQLLLGGVPQSQITIRKECTKGCTEDFFSYRNSHQCGRHVSFIMMPKKGN